MERKAYIRLQRILLIIILINIGTSTQNFSPETKYIATVHPIINETMYATYPNLWKLDMSNQTGFEFPVDKVLLIHDELSHFVCNNCSIHAIYQVSLSKLPLLTHLMLENNSLQYVHPDAFEHNPRLQNINLARNQLFSFNPEATIRHISSLLRLGLSQNEQFDLNRVNLNGSRLKFFTCNHCHTTFLDRKSLTSMPRLSLLFLSYNKLEKVDDDSLALAKNIKILNIDGNWNLTRLNLKSESLKKLSAKKCSLEGTLDTSELPKLEKINVRANRITQVNEHGFMRNPNINVVMLDDNLITKLPTVLLESPLNGLKQLCLDRNPLQPSHQVDETKTLYSSRNLRNGCLNDGNHLNKFENYLPNINGQAAYKKNPMHRLSSDGMTVDLSNRAIVYIEPDYLTDKLNVVEVLFDNNHSFDFKQHRVFLRSSKVERISLKNCSITTIYEETFKELHRLKHLDLQSNKIQSIHYDFLFKNNPGIYSLSLSHNDLEFISAHAFQKLEKLEVLQLDWNDRLSIKANDSFLLSTSLRKLSCRHCRFERLDKATLVGLPNLVELNLDYNHLATVDTDALLRTTRLRYLNLRHNQLVAFEPNINQLSYLKTLCLVGNPNFDFEHPKNKHLVADIQKIMELDKYCQEETFFHKLVEWYNSKKRSQNATTKFS